MSILGQPSTTPSASSAAAAPAPAAAGAAPAGGAPAPAAAAPAVGAAPAAGTPAAPPATPAGPASAAPTGAAPQAKPAEAAKAPEAAAPAPLALKLPEGVTLPDTVVGALAGTTKGPAEAQALVDALIGAEAARYEAAEKANVAAIRADPELGGAAFDANLILANRALEKFGGKEIFEVLGAAGLASHPAVFRLAVKLGHAFKEDSIAGLEGGGTARPAPFAAMYPNSPNLK